MKATSNFPDDSGARQSHRGRHGRVSCCWARSRSTGPPSRCTASWSGWRGRPRHRMTYGLPSDDWRQGRRRGEVRWPRPRRSPTPPLIAAASAAPGANATAGGTVRRAGRDSRGEGPYRWPPVLAGASSTAPEAAMGLRPVRCRWHAIQDRNWPTVSGNPQ